MPINKPIPVTIHATDFRDRVYTFVVESVLAPEATPGVVVVSASAGYWLSLSLTDRPGREQTIPYKKQPDGSWLASAIITVFYYGDSLPDNGTITVQGSLTETVTLTIAATPTLPELSKGPMLTVSQSTLTFAPTSPGKPSFELITVTQHYADGPVTITTDAPDYFQLATDSRPNFDSSLMFTPAPTGTYVHVRYLAIRRGFHTGQLTIQSSNDVKTIVLTGQSSGLLLAVRTTRTGSRRTQQSHSGPPSNRLKQGVGVLALLLTGGLVYSGYINRCQLFPALCKDLTTSQPLTSASRPVSASTNTAYRPKEIARQEKERKDTDKLTERFAQKSVIDGVTKRQAVVSPGVVRESADRTSKRPTDKTVNDVANSRRAIPTPPTEESELERELNQPTHNQL